MTSTPLHQRNELFSARLIENLRRRHIEACYCATASEAALQVSALIADGSSVSWGGSMTVRDMGLPALLEARGTLSLLDRDKATGDDVRRIYLQAMDADVYLTSANALSEDGVIVNVDGNGNRVAAITWGPRRVIHIISLNKVAPTVEDAIARARHTAAPVNAQRFDINTPCRRDGQCHDCNSYDSICSYIHLLRNVRNAGRHTVVLVGESMGY
ncbi:MAG: lactate utilization protein [Bacteroidaceae bacterium]|nr:lactate utilization protein [Bacteroidaceae bacterium]